MDNQKINYVTDEYNEIDLKYLFFLIWKGKWIIFLSLIVCVFFGIKNIISTPKIYTTKAIFGLEIERSNNYFARDLNVASLITGADSSNQEILTQMTGGNFLRDVVVGLNLLKKPEFSKLVEPSNKVSTFSITNLKIILKKLLGIDNKGQKYELKHSEKIEIVVNALRKNNLRISSLNTGGYQVEVSSTNPDDAALIANSVVKKFLDLRLQIKISKAEKSLEYLSQKLADAKVKLDSAKNAAEIFALEQNVLSNEEFSIQSRRLKEFRSSLEKLKESIAQLNNFHDSIKSGEIKEEDYNIVIETLLDISPRIKPPNRYLDNDGNRDLKKELVYIQKILPREILRLKESLEITNTGLARLEQKAKKTSAEARKLQNLEMDISFANARYEALLKEFETQSLVKGYESALGVVYEKAIPPLYPSSPKQFQIIILSIIIGLFLGLFLVLIKFKTNKKIIRKETFENLIDLNNCLSISKKLLKVRNLKDYFIKNKKSSILNKDILLLNSLGVFILNQKPLPKQITITCASLDSNLSSLSISVSLSFFFSSEKKKVLILDQTKGFKKLSIFASVSSKGNNANLSGIINLNQDILYKDISFKNKDNLTNHDNVEIIIKVIDYVGETPSSITEIQRSDFFMIIGMSNKSKISDIKRFKEAIGENKNKCLSGVFIVN